MPKVTINHGIVGPVTAKNVTTGPDSPAGDNNTAEQSSAPELIAMGDIDSFQAVREVPRERVAGLFYPLEVPEATIKRLLARILAEPFVPKDHGGEIDDLFTRVQVGGREVAASFLLKGPGLKLKSLTPAGLLGKNGDQIERMMTQPAELFVVQYVGGVRHSVYQRLHDAITARRAEGRQHAVGSIWDGVDTARLLTAYGYLDPDTGALLPAASERH